VGIDAEGMVHLRGAVTQPSSAGGEFGTLPPAYKPASGTMFLSATCVGIPSVPAIITISSVDGDIGVTASSGSQDTCQNTGFLTLEGLSFDAAGGG